MASEFIPIFRGWNVWTIFQTNELDFEAMLVGLTRDHRLQIFVEDAIRLGAAGAKVADPLALKGSQIEILLRPPADLEVVKRKEDLPGPSLTVDGPAELRTVRFFNRGDSTALSWPHSSNYLVEKVFKPSPESDATKGEPPPTVLDSTGAPDVLESAGKAAETAVKVVGLLAGAFVAWKILEAVRGKG